MIEYNDLQDDDDFGTPPILCEVLDVHTMKVAKVAFLDLSGSSFFIYSLNQFNSKKLYNILELMQLAHQGAKFLWKLDTDWLVSQDKIFHPDRVTV